MQLQYDLDVGALYIRLSGQPVARTREAGGDAHVDLAADGTLVGIEVLRSRSHGRWRRSSANTRCPKPS